MHCIIYDICGDYGHGDSADCCDDRSGPSSLLSRVLNAGGLLIVTVPMPPMIPAALGR